MAPILFTFFEKSPQTNGPRKTDPIAPHEIARIDTIVVGLKKARTTYKITKKTEEHLMRKVKNLSEAFLLKNPA